MLKKTIKPYCILFAHPVKYLLCFMLMGISAKVAAQVNCHGVIDSSKTEMCVANGSVTFSNASASGEKIEWISSGDGVFNDRFAQKPTYTPGPQDSANGYVFIYLDVYKDDTVNFCSVLPVMTLHLGTMNTVATPAYQTACANISITNLFFSSSLSSTTYTWTRDNYPLVGGSIPAGGTVNSTTPIKGTLLNNTTDPVLVTFTAIPNAGTCQGTPITAKVLVNPKATASTNPFTQTVCSGSNITPITFTSQANGTSYSWTRNKTDSVSGPASGTGSISGIFTNTNTVPVTVTFTIIPNANGCNGSPYSATVIVNPTAAVITTSPGLQTICSGTAIGNIISSGGVAGTVYNWARNNTSQATGIASSGAGNITGTLTNTTNAPVKVTFTVTPSTSACANRATVIVNPKPVAVATPASQTVCSGYAMAPINLSSLVRETSFTWTRDNTASVSGLPSNGSGNISGILVNNSNAPVTVTFTITPTANGCAGNPITATVTVTPRPKSVISGNYNLCKGMPSPNITINLAGSGPWNFTYSEGNTPVTITNYASNTYSFAPPLQPCTYTVTALSDASCAALSEDMTGAAVLTQQQYQVTVTAGANGIITSSDTSTIVDCGSDKTYTITPDAGFAVQDVLVDGISQGSISTYTFTNITAPHSISASFTSVSACTLPTISASVTDVVCKGSSTGSINLTVTGGSGPFTYAWSGPASFIANTKDIGSLSAGTYTLTLTATGGCSTIQTVNISEPATGLTATANAGTITCAGGTTTLTVTATGGSGTKQYSLNGGTYQTANTFTVNAAGGPYTVSVKDTSGCSTNSNTVTVADGTPVPAQPTQPAGQVFNLCGGGTFTYTLTPVPGATSYTWGTNTGGTIISGQGTTQVQISIPAQFTGVGTIWVTPRNACGNGTQYRFSVYAILYYNGSSDMTGPTVVAAGQTNVQYSVPYVPGISYNWTVPSRVTITSGQGTNAITVNFGPYGGNIGVATTNACGTSPRLNKNVSIGAARAAVTSGKESVGELSASVDLSVSPNPTRDIANVTFNSQKSGEKFEVVISNALGATLASRSGLTLPGKNQLQVALGKFSQGIYFIRLVTPNGIQTQKLLLEK